MYYLKYPKKCPACKQKAGAKILRGYPIMDDELQRALMMGTLVLGGCLVGENDADYRCTQCGHEWENPGKMIVGNMRDVYTVVTTGEHNKPYDVLCNQYQGVCTQKWNELIVTDRPGIRFCESCKEEVLLVRTRRELEYLRNTQQCVAYCGRGKLSAAV